MKNSVLLLVLNIIIPIALFGQITSHKVAETKDIPISDYDSLTNALLSNVESYKGQRLYLMPLRESSRTHGYNGFIKNYNKSYVEKSNIFERENLHSKYHAIAGKYFIVNDVLHNPNNSYGEESVYYLDITLEDSGKKLYYRYDTEYSSLFPFIVVGYFEKQKSLLVGNKLVFRGMNWMSSGAMKDINTGKDITQFKGVEWNCIDVSVEERFYSLSLILENPVHETISLSISSYNSQDMRAAYGIFDKDEKDYVISEYGIETWENVLDGIVKVGFTKELVLLAWGKPKKINKSSSGEQWVYDEKYLYFEGDKMTAFN